MRRSDEVSKCSDAEEGIATNILASRLKHLVEAGLLTREKARRGQRAAYSLTEAGIQVLPIMIALGNWGLAHRDGERRLRVRADLLSDGGAALVEAMIDELREIHLGGPRPDPTAPLPSQQLQAAYDAANGHGFPSDFSSPVVARLLEELHQGPPQPQVVAPPDEWMAILGTIPLVHQPGEGFTYNTAFDILGVLVARVSGRPFAHYLQDRVLRPLGMNDTGFSYPPGAIDRVTTSYRYGDEGALGVVDEPAGHWASEPAFASGAGGLMSTAADLVAFNRMLLAGGGGVLPHELPAAMMSDRLTLAIRGTDTVFLDGQTWGYGGSVDIAVHHPWNVLGRYGWVGGTGTSAYVVPSDESIAILLTQTELGGPTGAPLMESFWTAAATILGHGA